MRGFVLLMGEDLFRVQLGILAAKCRADNIFFHQMYFSFVLSGFVPLAEQDLFQVQPRNLGAKSFLLILRSSSLTELEEDLFRFVSRICFSGIFQFSSRICFEKSCYQDPSYSPSSVDPLSSLKERWIYPSKFVLLQNRGCKFSNKKWRNRRIKATKILSLVPDPLSQSWRRICFDLFQGFVSWIVSICISKQQIIYL